MARAKIWTEEQFKGYSIQKYTDGCREEILEAIVKIFHFMWERCGRRLFVCHLTVFLPERFEANGTTIIRTALHSWRSAKLNRHIQGEYNMPESDMSATATMSVWKDRSKSYEAS